jgi:hypothetical protein
MDETIPPASDCWRGGPVHSRFAALPPPGVYVGSMRMISQWHGLSTSSTIGVTARIAQDGSFHILSAPTLDGELSGRELVLLGSIARNNAVSIWKATDFFDPAPEPFQGTATTVTTTYGAALIKSVLKLNFELDTGRWFYANDASYSEVTRVLTFTLRRNAR